jgi:hypothetical protein
MRVPAKRPRLGKVLGVLVALMAMAPTAGNIGSCGQEAVQLDAEKFFEAKQAIDCARCSDCPVFSKACTAACGEAPVTGEFPDGCVPLVHDGEVCLDALTSASCSDYESFMADQGATIPTECDFCPLDESGQPRSGK